jgi:hypothetical protein
MSLWGHKFVISLWTSMDIELGRSNYLLWRSIGCLGERAEAGWSSGRVLSTSFSGRRFYAQVDWICKYWPLAGSDPKCLHGNTLGVLYVSTLLRVTFGPIHADSGGMVKGGWVIRRVRTVGRACASRPEPCDDKQPTSHFAGNGFGK